MNRLKDKIAIVTGAASGIGRGIVLAFCEQGAKIVVADVNEKGGKETVKMAKDIGGKAVFVKTDVSQAKDIDNMVNVCLKKYGRVDVLVNNAGILKFSPLHETSEDDWEKIIDINLKSVFLGSKRVLPEMLKQKRGKIISITSIAGLVGYPQIGAYCASKGGIIALTKSMALDYAKQNININCIAPGAIETAMTKDMLADPVTKKALEASTPYSRIGVPKDIAMMTVYLASDESDFVNGAVMVVDGGYIAQ